MSRRLIKTETNGKRMVKVYDDGVWGEYVCELFELKPKSITGNHFTLDWFKNPDASYHTCGRSLSDKEDALSTAIAMAKPLFNFLESELSLAL